MERGGGSYKQGTAMTGPATLASLIRDGKLLWTYCNNCYRERDLDPASIPLPGAFPVPDVGRRMKCSACGSRRITTQPEHCPGGVVAARIAVQEKYARSP